MPNQDVRDRLQLWSNQSEVRRVQSGQFLVADSVDAMYVQTRPVSLCSCFRAEQGMCEHLLAALDLERGERNENSVKGVNCDFRLKEKEIFPHEFTLEECLDLLRGDRYNTLLSTRIVTDPNMSEPLWDIFVAECQSNIAIELATRIGVVLQSPERRERVLSKVDHPAVALRVLQHTTGSESAKLMRMLVAQNPYGVSHMLSDSADLIDFSELNGTDFLPLLKSSLPDMKRAGRVGMLRAGEPPTRAVDSPPEWDPSKPDPGFRL